MCVRTLVKCVVLPPLCVFPCVCTSVMCCNGVGGERRTDSEDPSWWQRQPLPPDEQRSDWWERDTTLSLSSSRYSLAHFHSIALFSFSIYSSPHSVPPSHSHLYLSQAVSPPPPPLSLSLVISLLLFLAVRCSFALHFSLSLYFLSHFTHSLSLSVSIYVPTYLSKFKFALLAWT